MYKIFGLFCTLFLVLSCSKNRERIVVEDTSTLQLLEMKNPDVSGLDFANNIQETREINSFTFDGLLQGSGVAVIDFDNDGYQDVFFASSQGKDQLYRNKGGMTFENVTTKAGILQGDYYLSLIHISEPTRPY